MWKYACKRCKEDGDNEEHKSISRDMFIESASIKIRVCPKIEVYIQAKEKNLLTREKVLCCLTVLSMFKNISTKICSTLWTKICASFMNN